MPNLEVIGEGKTTKVYRDGDRAVKLYVNAPPDEAYNEAKKQAIAVNAGLSVPKVYGVRQLAEGVALDMEYIPGVPLFTNLDKDGRIIALEEFIKLQCTVHEVITEELPKQTDALTWKIEHAKKLDNRIIEKLFNLLNELNKNKSNLCHGDFHPLNILRADEKLWIIDWVDATRGDPLADACRTYLIFRQYMLRMANMYLRIFCKTAAVKQEDVLVWLPIAAAGRLHENLSDKERTFLMNIINETIL